MTRPNQLRDGNKVLDFCIGLDELDKEDVALLANIGSTRSVPCIKLKGDMIAKAVDAIRWGSRERVLDVSMKTPVGAIKYLARSFHDDSERCEWIVKARMLAIVGSCPKSLPSIRSGINCWGAFARNVLRVKLGMSYRQLRQG